MKKFLLFSAALLLVRNAGANPAHALTVGDGFSNPLGFHDVAPRFSWKLPEGVKKQSAYHIESNAGDMRWDSGWVNSDRSRLVPYGGKPFASRQKVTWRVNFRDENGKESGWSEPASFEMGLLSTDDWKARWIRPAGEGDPQKESVATLRRRFPISGKIAAARIYVTARGLFELELNGRRVSKDCFANGWTSYHKRIDTLTYDVTSQLRSGENTIQASLGTGWYAGRLTWGKNQKGKYGANPELLMQLEITREDGSKETIATDGQWEGTYQGPIVSSSIYDGEEYDARRETAGWAPVRVNADLGSEILAPSRFLPSGPSARWM